MKGGYDENLAKEAEKSKNVKTAKVGGRRRKSRKSRKMRGGNGYGFVPTSGSVINAGNIAWTPNMTSVPDGVPKVGSVDSGLKGGRRRKSRKASKKAGRRRRTMRGGGSVGVVGAAFTGTGARGIADYVPYAANVPPGGAFAIPTGTR